MVIERRLKFQNTNLMKRHLLIFFILVSSALLSFSQGAPQGFKYQTVLRFGSGTILPNQTVHLKFSFFSGSIGGTMVWEEVHTLASDANGLIETVIGTGVNSGSGTLASFGFINWSTSSYYLKVSVDMSLSGSYIAIGNTQLFSVPYAFYSKQTSTFDNISLSQFNDVNVSGIAAGKLLKWDGSYWVPAVDNSSDTVLYSYNAGHSGASDTAFYAYGNAPDTVLFSYDALNASSSQFSGTAVNSVNAGHSDTALYSLASPPTAWQLTGNTVNSSSYIGTNTAADFNFRTNNLNRLTMYSGGKLTVGSSANNGSLNVTGNDGIVEIGTLGSGTLSVSGAGTRMMWFPRKGAFRAGGVTSNQWDTANIGFYSMAVGYDTKSGINSFSSGHSCESVDYAFTTGHYSRALSAGAYPSGNGIAMGDSCLSSAPRALTMGKNNTASLTTCIAIGRNNVSSGSVSVAFGVNNTSNAQDTHVFGSNASANGKNGAFVYGDASTTSVLNAVAINQFTVRAAGGVLFYTDSARTMGVSVAAGSGSWASVSDVNKKENFKDVSDDEILAKIQELKILSWNYKSQSRRIRHVGPIAQEFYSIFHFGESETAITGVDIDGVILCGIKALDRRNNALLIFKEIDTLKDKANQQQTGYNQLNNRLDKIEAVLDSSK